MASEYTEHFNLDLYTDNDRPNLRDQYNAAIRKIDNKLFDQVTTINLLDSVVDDLKEDVEQAQTDISNEVTARTNADTALGTRIDNETTARESADQTLTTDLAAEVTAREGADTTLDNKITAETTARTGADTALQSSIDTLEGKFPIGTNDISDGAVTSAKIADGAVTASKIPNGIIADSKLVSRTYGFVGDSFSEETTYPWVGNLASLLNAPINNKAVSGAGFARPGKTFTNQLTQLKADGENYTDIIVYGGVNDESFSEAEIRTGVSTFCNYLNQNFPQHPVLHLFIGNMPMSNPRDIKKVVQTVYHTALANYDNVRIYPNINGWQIAHFGWITLENIHPSDAFRAELPYLFARALKTGNTDISIHYFPDSSPSESLNVTVNKAAPLICTNTTISTPPVNLAITGGGAMGQVLLQWEGIPSTAAFPDAGWQNNYLNFQGLCNYNGNYVFDMHSLFRLKLYGITYTSGTMSVACAPLTAGIVNG